MQTVDLAWFARQISMRSGTYTFASQKWAVMVRDVEPLDYPQYVVARGLERVAAEHIVRLHNRHIQGSIYWDEDEDD